MMSLGGIAAAATPTITWATPAPMAYGTLLGTQLNAHLHRRRNDRL